MQLRNVRNTRLDRQTLPRYLALRLLLIPSPPPCPASLYLRYLPSSQPPNPPPTPPPSLPTQPHTSASAPSNTLHSLVAVRKTGVACAATWTDSTASRFSAHKVSPTCWLFGTSAPINTRSASSYKKQEKEDDEDQYNEKHKILVVVWSLENQGGESTAHPAGIGTTSTPLLVPRWHLHLTRKRRPPFGGLLAVGWPVWRHKALK